ncbi:MAG TPA: alpha/beta hydrolase [Actinocrinis sp.]|nr:alpha/beta hydrolase [Actinocrinis sp.]
MSGNGQAEAQMQERWTPSGVRLRQITAGPGRWNWLFVPGGPGLGSESLAGLVETADVPGTVWLVDLPGDGSNRALPTVPHDPYAGWPDVIAEAARAVDDPVMVGHSTGGMFMLSAPELEGLLTGMVLVSSAPHAAWRAMFGNWAEQHPLPQVDAAADQHARNPDDQTLRALTIAAAPWSFTEAELPAGRRLLADLRYCHEAVAWADANFDETFESRWSPRALPTLILSGGEDRVVDQTLWDAEPAFDRPTVLRRRIPGAGHFPWLGDPGAVRSAFADLVDLLDGQR